MVTLVESEREVVVSRGLRGGETRELLINGNKVLVKQDDQVLEICCTTSYL